MKEERTKKVTKKSPIADPGYCARAVAAATAAMPPASPGVAEREKSRRVTVTKKEAEKRRKREKERARKRKKETWGNRETERRRERTGERKREEREECAAWLSVAIINHVLVSRLAPRRQGYLTKGIRQ